MPAELPQAGKGSDHFPGLLGCDAQAWGRAVLTAAVSPCAYFRALEDCSFIRDNLTLKRRSSCRPSGLQEWPLEDAVLSYPLLIYLSTFLFLFLVL